MSELRTWLSVLLSDQQKMNLANLNLDALYTFLDTCTANPALKEKIQKEITARIPANKKYSREYLYSVNIVGKKALFIYFIPESQSFTKYGRKITVNLFLDDETRNELAENYAAKPAVRTHGWIKAESLDPMELDDDLRKALKSNGFNTVDIMLVTWE